MQYDHVFMLIDNYNFGSAESRRLLYVTSSRAKRSLHIHTNIDFYDGISAKYITRTSYLGQLDKPKYYEMILGHKDIHLSSLQYPRSLRIVQQLKTGEALQYDELLFEASTAIGLKKPGQNGNLLLFSRKFIKDKYNPMVEKGYSLSSASVEYLVYWYDKDKNKEFKIVLPRLRFELMS